MGIFSNFRPIGIGPETNLEIGETSYLSETDIQRVEINPIKQEILLAYENSKLIRQKTMHRVRKTRDQSEKFAIPN